MRPPSSVISELDRIELKHRVRSTTIEARLTQRPGSFSWLRKELRPLIQAKSHRFTQMYSNASGARMGMIKRFRKCTRSKNLSRTPWLMWESSTNKSRSTLA